MRSSRRQITRQLDFVSIDVEGLQLDVMRGFDLARHRPALLLIEDPFLDWATHLHLRRRGYRLVRRSGGLNSWYVPREHPFRAPVTERLKLLRYVWLGTPFPPPQAPVALATRPTSQRTPLRPLRDRPPRPERKRMARQPEPGQHLRTTNRPGGGSTDLTSAGRLAHGFNGNCDYARLVRPLQDGGGGRPVPCAWGESGTALNAATKAARAKPSSRTKAAPAPVPFESLAQPAISWLFPAGGRRGTEVQVTVGGTNLIASVSAGQPRPDSSHREGGHRPVGGSDR